MKTAIPHYDEEVKVIDIEKKRRRRRAAGHLPSARTLFVGLLFFATLMNMVLHNSNKNNDVSGGVGDKGGIDLPRKKENDISANNNFISTTRTSYKY